MEIESEDAGGIAPAQDQDSYVALILKVMQARRIGIRSLATIAKMTKSRVASLLHHDRAKRSPMTFKDLRVILQALDLDLLQAVVCAETLLNDERYSSPRYAALVPMLCTMFYGLPANLIAALDELDDMDGSEVRPEWAPVIQQALIKRVVHEVAAVANRRAAINDFSLFA